MRHITIHCSATKPTLDIGVEEIREMHKIRGWSDVGYHFIIRRDGEIEEGRPLSRTGAHVKGYNDENIGICLVGGYDLRCRPVSNYTADQWLSLRHLVINLIGIHGIPFDEVCGHRDWPGVNKDCPCFSVTEWLNNDMFPTEGMRKCVNSVLQ